MHLLYINKNTFFLFLCCIPIILGPDLPLEFRKKEQNTERELLSIYILLIDKNIQLLGALRVQIKNIRLNHAM